MNQKKLFLAGSIIGIALMIAPAVFAASATAGLSLLTLRGVGTGSLASGDCLSPLINCPTNDVCSCLIVSDKVLGTLTFNGGSLAATISVDTSNALPVTTIGGVTGNCFAATGVGTILNSNGKQQLDLVISGLTCSTTGDVETFNGTYVIQGGAGSFANANGTGSINGSQVIVPGSTRSQVFVSGTVQR